MLQRSRLRQHLVLLIAVLNVFALVAPAKARDLDCRASETCGARCNHTEFWRKFPEFQRRKRHDAALLLGNGESANLLGRKEGRLMMDVADIFVTNQFFVHQHVTPDFHHIEIKGFTERFWQDNFTPEIKKKYRDRNTFVWSLIRTMKNDAPEYCRNADGGVGQRKCMADCGPCSQRVLDMTGSPSFVYSMESMLSEEQVAMKAAGEHLSDPKFWSNILKKTKACSVQKAQVQECALGKSCYSSMTTVLDMIVRMGYKRLYILGVDLNSHRHFYNAGTPSAGELKREYKHLILPRSMNETDSGEGVHKTATLGVQHFIPALIAQYGIEGFNLSPTGLLREHMKTLSLGRVAMLERRRQISARRRPRPNPGDESDHDHDDTAVMDTAA